MDIIEPNKMLRNTLILFLLFQTCSLVGQRNPSQATNDPEKIVLRGPVKSIEIVVKRADGGIKGDKGEILYNRDGTVALEKNIQDKTTITNTYNEAGQLILVSSEHERDNGLQDGVNYSYDDAGRLIKSMRGSMLQATEYLYDEEDRILRQRKFEMTTNRTLEDTQYDYLQQTNDRYLKTFTKYQIGADTKTTTYTCSKKDDRMLRLKYTDGHNSTFQYVYFGVSVKTEYSPQAKVERTFSYSYDPFGHVKDCELKAWQNSVVVKKFSYLYKYDHKGSIISDTRSNNKVGSALRTTTTSYTYDYDEYNNWIRCTKFKDEEKKISVHRTISYYSPEPPIAQTEGDQAPVGQKGSPSYRKGQGIDFQLMTYAKVILKNLEIKKNPSDPILFIPITLTIGSNGRIYDVVVNKEMPGITEVCQNIFERIDWITPGRKNGKTIATTHTLTIGI